jgi:hypothetical protein
LPIVIKNKPVVTAWSINANSLPLFSSQFILPARERKYSELAASKLGPSGENVWEQNGETSVIVEPPDVDCALFLLSLELRDVGENLSA